MPVGKQKKVQNNERDLLLLLLLLIIIIIVIIVIIIIIIIIIMGINRALSETQSTFQLHKSVGHYEELHNNMPVFQNRECTMHFSHYHHHYNH